MSGAAAAGGVTYQALVAAYFCVQVLAEEVAPELPGMHRLPVSVWCETTEALDDIRVETADGRRLLVQAKRSLQSETSADSELAKVCAQLVASTDDDDQLLIAVGRTASGTIKDELRVLLEGLRPQPDGPFRSDTLSKKKAEVQRTLLGHLRRCWKRRHKTSASTAELRSLLRRTWLVEIDVEGQGSDARLAEYMLRNTVIAEAVQAPAAWRELGNVSQQLMVDRTGTGRARLAGELMRRRIGLQAVASVRSDISRVQSVTATNLLALTDRSQIELLDGTIRIDRELPAALEKTLEDGSVLLVGEPGIGKSGAVYQIVSNSRQADRPTVLLLAEELEAGTQAALAQELLLGSELAAVIEHWPTQHGLLVIDGLDAAGTDSSRAALTELIRRVCKSSPAWRILASIRTFDLRNDDRLGRLFMTDPSKAVESRWTTGEFSAIRHLAAGRLTDSEIDQLAAPAPELFDVATTFPQPLQELARVPFNLRLLAELVQADLSKTQLRRIDGQVGLLEAYWKSRILNPSTGRSAREQVLARVCELALGSARITISRAALRSSAVDQNELDELLRRGVLIERSAGSGLPDSERLSFAHNVLFDYAVARLLLRAPGQLHARLKAEPALLLRVRPSVELHMRWLWSSDETRAQFWMAAIDLAADDQLSELAKTVAPAVAADLVADLEDLRPLLDALASDPEAAEGTLRHLLGALVTFAEGSELVSEGSPWPGFLRELAR